MFCLQQDCRAIIHDTRVSSAGLSPTSLISMSLHSPITTVQYHPTEENMLLLGTECGSLVVADRRKMTTPVTTDVGHFVIS
jgi:hypothetical protein